MTATTTTRTLAAAVGLATSAALLAGVTSSEAATRAKTTVTIKAEGIEVSGTVKSKRKVCKDGRKVLVFKQKGAKGGGDDKRIGDDTTELVNGVGVWETGQLGQEGRLYAKVKRTKHCKGAVSRTIRVVRND